MFYLSFVLLPIEIDPILEKQSYKKNALVAHGTNYIEIVLILSIKVVALPIQAFMV